MTATNTIDQQFVEYVVKTIVGNPDAVSIKRTIDEKGVLLELTVDPNDLGRVIGKRGSGAQALRTLLRALGTKNEARYNLKIIDVGDNREDRPPRDDDSRDVASDRATSVAPVSAPDETEQSQVEPVVSVNDAVAVNDEPAEEAPVASAEPEEDTQTEDAESDSTSSYDKTRRELADLDDLDI